MTGMDTYGWTVQHLDGAERTTVAEGTTGSRWEAAEAVHTTTASIVRDAETDFDRITAWAGDGAGRWVREYTLRDGTSYRGTIELMGSVEYRGVVVCTEDPCSYCHAPRQEHRTGRVLATADAALEHARAQARKVHGESTHRAVVEAREVGPWTTLLVGT